MLRAHSLLSQNTLHRNMMECQAMENVRDYDSRLIH